jgi:methionyl-tRNA formyltransferase
MRLAFMGTPDFAVPTLDALIDAGHEILAVYSQPPRRAGRGKALRPSPVQRRAEGAGLDVMTPATLRDEAAQRNFAALHLDAAVVAAYGLILPPAVLEAPRQGCLNVHASLLPRWRGAAPIQRAILAGDAKTGVSIMAMERGLDTGPVYARRETEIDRKTAGELSAELAAMGGALMAEVLDRLNDNAPEPQTEAGVTYASKVDKAEARLDFSQPAIAVERQIRAFNPAPGAYFEHRGERIRLLAADISELSGAPGTVLDHGLAVACGEGSVVPTLVQRAGRAAMPPGELLRGFLVPVGTRLA